MARPTTIKSPPYCRYLETARRRYCPESRRRRFRNIFRTPRLRDSGKAVRQTSGWRHIVVNRRRRVSTAHRCAGMIRGALCWCASGLYYGTTVCVGDAVGDGFDDLYVCHAGLPNRFT